VLNRRGRQNDSEPPQGSRVSRSLARTSWLIVSNRPSDPIVGHLEVFPGLMATRCRLLASAICRNSYERRGARLGRALEQVGHCVGSQPDSADLVVPVSAASVGLPSCPEPRALSSLVQLSRFHPERARDPAQ
jgi:hypothetical protein